MNSGAAGVKLAIFASFFLAALGVAAFAEGSADTSELSAGAIQESQNWSSFFGNDKAWAFSSLAQINSTNVSQLLPAWTFSTGEKGLGSAPLIIDGVMYLLAPRSQVFALDAATGRLLWSYKPDLPPSATPRPSLGMATGLGMLFFATGEHHLVALDTKTGQEVWDVQIEDPAQCACWPGWAPIFVKNKIVLGQSSESGHRGFLSAFDAKTGKLSWRFYTIPGPGEPGHDSWPEALWKVGSGGTWYVGSYDPEFNLIYWGIGNPGPMLGGHFPGNKLYTQSIVALDADTGKLKWHFQETPDDKLDYDSVLEPVLIDVEDHGKTRKLLIHSTKGGFAYVVDRVTGAYVRSFPFSDSINWTKGIGPDGKPMEPLLQISETEDTLVCPGVYGARAGGHSSYSPQTRLWYTTSYEECTLYRAINYSGPPREGRDLVAVTYHKDSQLLPGKQPFVAAFDPLTGEKKWENTTVGPNLSSLLTTAGDLLFGGDIFGDAWAWDATTGKNLWSFNIGSGISGVPVTYAVGGRQYVAIGAGTNAYGTVLAMSLLTPEQRARVPPTASTLFVFALPSTSSNTSTKP